MNEQQLRRVLTEIAEDIAPAEEINEWPMIEQRLEEQVLLTQKRSILTNRYGFRDNLRRVAYVVVAFFLIGLVFLATPYGRVWAQEVLKFFTRSMTDTLPLQSWQLTPQPTLAPGVAGSDPASILEAKFTVNEVEEQSGFKIKEPSWLPENLKLVGATYDPVRSLVRIFYRLEETNGLVLKEEYFDRPDSCALCNEVGASANVEIVQIGSVTGEYVQGVWKLTDNGPVWENDPYLQTLRWQLEGMAFELQFMGPPDRLTKEDLVKIAKSLE
jgi:hypothetical protein